MFVNHLAVGIRSLYLEWISEPTAIAIATVEDEYIMKT